MLRKQPIQGFICKFQHFMWDKQNSRRKENQVQVIRRNDILTPLPNPKMPWTKTIGGGSSGEPSKTTTFPLLSSSSLAVRLKMLGVRQCVATWDRSVATAVLKMYNPKSICTIELRKSSINPRINLAIATTVSFLPEFNFSFFFLLIWGDSPLFLSLLSLNEQFGERENEKRGSNEREMKETVILWPSYPVFEISLFCICV